MSFSPSSPITGSAQSGLTNPTYTITVDVAPTNTGKQYACTALGGTQTGVTTHSVSSPFTMTFSRPKALKVLGPPAANGYIANVPRNTYRLIIRKGVTPAVNQPATVMLITCDMAIPVGSDTYDAVNVRAALSAMIGLLSQVSSGIGDTVVSAIL